MPIVVLRKPIAFDFHNKRLPFTEVASSGSTALALFYFWYQNIKANATISFLFIDEFDAFYHHSLSALIVEKIKRNGCSIYTYNS
jgi:hypothetical protein